MAQKQNEKAKTSGAPRDCYAEFAETVKAVEKAVDSYQRDANPLIRQREELKWDTTDGADERREKVSAELAGYYEKLVKDLAALRTEGHECLEAYVTAYTAAHAAEVALSADMLSDDLRILDAVPHMSCFQYADLLDRHNGNPLMTAALVAYAARPGNEHLAELVPVVPVDVVRGQVDAWLARLDECARSDRRDPSLDPCDRRNVVSDYSDPRMFASELDKEGTRPVWMRPL